MQDLTIRRAFSLVSTLTFFSLLHLFLSLALAFFYNNSSTWQLVVVCLHTRVLLSNLSGYGFSSEVLSVQALSPVDDTEYHGLSMRDVACCWGNTEGMWELFHVRWPRYNQHGCKMLNVLQYFTELMVPPVSFWTKNCLRVHIQETNRNHCIHLISVFWLVRIYKLNAYELKLSLGCW